MADLRIPHLVNEQFTGKQQIHYNANFAGIAVFQRQDNTVRLALFNSLVRSSKIGVGNQVCLGEHTPGRQIAIGPFHAAVCDLHSVQQPALIGAGQANDIA